MNCSANFFLVAPVELCALENHVLPYLEKAIDLAITAAYLLRSAREMSVDANVSSVLSPMQQSTC